MLHSADTVFKVVHLPLSYYQTIFFSTFKGTALSKTFKLKRHLCIPIRKPDKRLIV